ncbi:MAG: Fic family protein [Armatimonadetes bacterium]|nr:Fic family protein [Armatimonadota bacterium]
MHYLTVPDLVWLNLQLTGSPQKYNYATLEEGVFYQYAYGSSTDVFAQAARLLTGFARLRPFASGNNATALAATVGFLAINGQELRVEGLAWLESLFADPASAADKIQAACHAHGVHLKHGIPDSRQSLQQAVDANRATLGSLLASEPVAELVG